MKTFRPIHWSALLLLLLAACGGDSVPDFKGDTVEVRVFSSLNAAASALSVQGVPFDPETGETGVSFALVDVFSGDTQLLFEEGRVVSEGGGPIVLNPDSNEETVFLPEGRYRFALRAFGAQSDDNVIALGEVEQQIGQDSRVTVPVTSLIGSARFEVPESVDANEVFDAFLKVSPPGRPDLEVPLGDYSVTYDVAEPSVKLAGESKLGVRVAAACAVVEVTATVDNDLSDEVSATANVPVSSDACDNSTDVGTDLVPPFVSIAAPIDGTTVGTSFTLSGDVSDQQSGVERVEVYEGTLKLGEADIDMDEMSWFFDTTLEEGTYTLIAIAFDKAGNTSRKEITLTVKEGSDGEGGQGECKSPVQIPDDALRDAIRSELGKLNSELTCEDLASLSELSYQGDIEYGPTVKNLEGLQYAVNLERLRLNEIAPGDYSPIANLTKLETLNLKDSSRSDLSFLTNLTNLVELNLGSYLFGNGIEDITPLQNLKKLEKLNLAGFYEIAIPSGDIEDISPLEGLTNLTELDLGGQPVTDLSPLVANSGLGEGDKIILGGAQGGGLDDICYDETYRTDVEALRERGVDVDTNFDDYPICKSEPDGDGNITVTSTSGAASLENECTLRAAITAANTDSAVGGCKAGNGADVIQLAENTMYTFTESDNGQNGQSGLPKIASDITIAGGGSTLQPDQNSQRINFFRIFQVEASGKLTLEAVTVIGESGTSIDGLAIYNAGTTTLRNSKVTGGSCEGDGLCNGGGIFNLGTLRLFGSEVSGNFVYNGGGGGIYNEGGEVTIVNSVVADNGTVDGGRGGNLYNVSGNVRIEQSIIRGGASGVGGGIDNAGSLEIVNTLLVDNIAESVSSDSESIGTGSALFNTGKATVSFSTFVGPEEFFATEGEDGSTINNRGELILEATLISSQADYPSCTGSFTSRGYNLNSDDTCGLTQRSDIVNTAPLLGENSVPAAGSPALNKIPANACTVETDQRGVSRPQGAACDIGAFELEQ